MSEQTMRGNVVRRLRPLDAFSVENRVLPGTPDVNFVGGWMELKWLRRWPVNADDSPVLIEHFTPEQRAVIARRWRRGGGVYLLLQVGRDWLLFDGDVAALHVGRVERPRLLTLCAAHWNPKLDTEELIDYVSRRA